MSKLDELIKDKGIPYQNSGYSRVLIDADDLRELGKEFVLVPREPTEEMIKAAIHKWHEFHHYNGDDDKEWLYQKYAAEYKAMIQASE